jgi:hypothetical protein
MITVTKYLLNGFDSRASRFVMWPERLTKVGFLVVSLTCLLTAAVAKSHQPGCRWPCLLWRWRLYQVNGAFSMWCPCPDEFGLASKTKDSGIFLFPNASFKPSVAHLFLYYFIFFHIVCSDDSRYYMSCVCATKCLRMDFRLHCSFLE